MSGMRTIVISTAAVAVLGLGYGMWSIVSPGEEMRKEKLKRRQKEGAGRDQLPIIRLPAWDQMGRRPG
ncbi:hypothetical protein ATANTOWER_019676 [Ataeniobius toweri]|uniref:Ubiquinol-cytochrome-c reductase complex assembly factor 3 n=1 Tax=Ataeniobius toweri TaxID=208326 RepID=A0ABU7C3P3_9TELE|nr:hypothetical protein [Ataeniobius toweri]